MNPISLFSSNSNKTLYEWFIENAQHSLSFPFNLCTFMDLSKMFLRNILSFSIAFFLILSGSDLKAFSKFGE